MTSDQFQEDYIREDRAMGALTPFPSSRDLKTFLREIERDPLGCFAGCDIRR
jgi:hypothetical protein